MAATRILIVDDHPAFRNALRGVLTNAVDNVETVEAGTLEELAKALANDQGADLILLDLSIPGANGFSGLMYLRSEYPEIPVLVVSAASDPRTMRRVIECGASGFVPKSRPIEDIRAAVRAVLEGGQWLPNDMLIPDASDRETTAIISKLSTLTPQQVRVLAMLGKGLLNKQIAFELGVSEATIKAHVSAILQKLGVDSRTQAVIAINRVEAADRSGTS